MNPIAFLIKLAVILVVGGWLLGPEGLKRLAGQGITLTWLVAIGVFLVLTISPRGSNPLLRTLFTWSWLIALIAIVVLYANFEQDAKAYIVNRVCHTQIGGWQLVRPICGFFGVR